MPRLSLINDARRTWHRLWSVRLAILSGLLSAAEFALPFVPPELADLIGPRRFAAAAFVIAMAAAVARVVAQPKARR